MFPERIETDRLVLRPFRYEDATDMMSYANDEEWSRFIAPPYPYTRDYAETFVRNQITGKSASKAVWCIEYKDRMIGDINLAIETTNWSAEISYNLARKYWGKGLMTEALTEIIDAAFTLERALNRLFVRIDTRNLASIRVAEKLGLKQEGVLRQNRFHKGDFVDDVILALLRHERRATAA
jgi:RimJ/RimL family protein N-acetyltransferase